MNRVLKRTLLASSLIVPLAFGAHSVSADPILEWGYQVDSTFDNWSSGGGTMGGITASDGDRKLSWGGSPQSSISITDVNESSGLVTNGDYVLGGTFTHTNNVLSSDYNALTSFDLISVLTLTPFNPPGAALSPDSTTFASFFIETPNDGDCVAAAGSNCDDIFTIGNIDALNPVQTADGYAFSSDFVHGDHTYTLFLQLAGLEALDSDACTAAGAPDGCVGLLTEENEVNEFQTRFRITTMVPEPGTLALLGLGLAGLGLTRRRKAAKS